MLLQALRDLADRDAEECGPSLPAKYQPVLIRWLIDLDEKGHCRGFVTLGDDEKTRGKRIECPFVMRSSAIRARLLADNGEYVLGYPRLGASPRQIQRVAEGHNDFVRAVRECALATGEPAVQAVVRFLEPGADPSALPLPADFDPAANMTFRVNDVMPIDLPAVRAYWASTGIGADAASQQCLVCGCRAPAVARHQIKIKRVPGGQQSGVAIISANQEAFESFGLEASAVGPTCETCSEAFHNALNSLIADNDSSLRIGPVLYVFWTRGEESFSPARVLQHPDPSEVRALLQAARTGRERAAVLDTTQFYAVALSGSGARLVVRDWLDTTVTSVQRSLAAFFRRQHIAGARDDASAYFGIWVLAAATARDAKKDLSPNVPLALTRCAVHGARIPAWVLDQVVRRARGDQGVSRPQAALIKLALLSDPATEEELGAMTQLDPSLQRPAYLCGRLLATLEHIQRAALGSIGATIVDRYYGTASSAPAVVFGRLLTLSQAHMSRLRKEKPGAFVTLERTLKQVLQGLAAFPRTLTLEEQGLFALGYYHQKVHGWSYEVNAEPQAGIESNGVTR